MRHLSPAVLRDGLRWLDGAWLGLLCAVPGPVSTQEEAAEFVGSPDDEGERGDGGELGAGERCGAEEAVQGGYVDQRGGEGQCDDDSAEQVPVGEHAHRAE